MTTKFNWNICTKLALNMSETRLLCIPYTIHLSASLQSTTVLGNENLYRQSFNCHRTYDIWRELYFLTFTKFIVTRVTIKVSQTKILANNNFYLFIVWLFHRNFFFVLFKYGKNHLSPGLLSHCHQFFVLLLLRNDFSIFLCVHGTIVLYLWTCEMDATCFGTMNCVMKLFWLPIVHVYEPIETSIFLYGPVCMGVLFSSYLLFYSNNKNRTEKC